MVNLVKPVDVVGAGLAPGPITPFVVGVVGVPFVDALEVAKKRCFADRNLLTWSADKPFETVEDVIHRLPQPRWSGFRIPC